MNRSGYSEEYDDNWTLIRWRGVVASSIRGKRGQAFLRELVEALDAMPEKRLIAHELRQDGEVCALGSVGAKRGIDLESIDPEDHATLSRVFNVAEPLIQEVEYMNDEGAWYNATPEQRWQSMRAWAVEHIKATP